jgi:sugar lactone lactonase YvrE
MKNRISSYLILLIATLGLVGCGGNGTTPTKNSVPPVVYVLDANGARVEVFDTSGNYLSQFGYAFSQPNGIATDAQGNVYVRDGNLNCSVDKFDRKGNFLLQIGKCGVAGGGAGPGIFDNAGQLATDASGNLWVTSPDYQTIQKFDGSGTFQKIVCMSTAVNNCPMATAQIEVPNNIALDAQGNIYVATNSVSGMANTILKFDSSGNYVSSIGSTFSHSSQYLSPAGIVFDAAGDMYAVDSGNGRVQKFDSQGNYLSEFGSVGNGVGQFTGAPGAISIDSSGNVYVTDYYGYRVLVFDGNGNYLRQFGTYGTGNGQFTGVLGVAVSR